MAGSPAQCVMSRAFRTGAAPRKTVMHALPMHGGNEMGQDPNVMFSRSSPKQATPSMVRVNPVPGKWKGRFSPGINASEMERHQFTPAECLVQTSQQPDVVSFSSSVPFKGSN